MVIAHGAKEVHLGKQRPHPHRGMLHVRFTGIRGTEHVKETNREQ